MEGALTWPAGPRRFNAVARRPSHQRNQGHLAIDHGVAVSPFVPIHEVLVGPQSIADVVLLGLAKRPTTTVLHPTGAVHAVVCLHIQPGTRVRGFTPQPAQGLGKTIVGQTFPNESFVPVESTTRSSLYQFRANQVW